MTDAMLSDDEAWDAFQRRDRAYDGRVIAGVLTTGIYCKPSCAAATAIIRPSWPLPRMPRVLPGGTAVIRDPLPRFRSGARAMP